MITLQKNISDMKERGELCDIVVVVEKEKFYVHKLVLAAASAFFHAMFTSEFREKDKSEIELIGQTADSFRCFLCYVYDGKVDLCEENIGDVYGVAVYLQAQEFMEYCEKIMMENIKADTYFRYLPICEQFPCSPVFDKAVQIISCYFSQLRERQSLYGINASIYKEILRRKYLADVAEEDILETTFKWIETNGIEDEIAVTVLQEIRWGLLEVCHLEVLPQNIRIMANEECQKMVQRAINYLKNERMQPILGGKFSTPRGVPVLAAIGGDTGYFIHDSIALGADRQRHYMLNSSFWIKQNIIEELPMPMHYRECNASVVVNNILFLVGGNQYDYDEDENTYKTASANLFKYTPLLNRWDMLTPLRRVRSGHVAVGVEYAGVPHLMVIGGCSKVIGDVSTTVVYDIENDLWSESNSFPHQVFAPAACVYEGMVYVSGGRDESQSKDFMFRYSPNTQQWEQLSNMLVRRSGHFMCAIGNNIYIVGGHSKTEMKNDTQVYNPKLNQYSKVEWDCSFNLVDGNMIAYNDCIYAIDGDFTGLILNTTSKDVKKDLSFSYSKEPFRDFQESYRSTLCSALAVIHVRNEVVEIEDELSSTDSDDIFFGD